MSKIKASNKYIRQLYANIFYTKYCNLEDIMCHEEPLYYNCGVYGWNWDCYVDFEYDVAITTGYRNTIGRKIPQKLIDKYTALARNIKNIQFDEKVTELYDYSEQVEYIRRKLDDNRKAFFKELSEI